MSPRKRTAFCRGGWTTRQQNWVSEDPGTGKHSEQIWICMACLPSRALPWVSRPSDSQPQASRTACNGKVTRARLSLLRPEFALSQLKIRKMSKEAAADVLNCWPVLLEQCKSCERDQLRKWRRQAAPVLTNNPVRPSHYTSPQTPPTEATLRGQTNPLIVFSWICHKHLLPSEPLSSVHPERSLSQIIRTCKTHYIQQSLQYCNGWRLDPICLMAMGSKFQKPFIISVLPV